MSLFDEHIAQIRKFIDQRRQRPDVSVVTTDDVPAWPMGDNRNLVLSSDTAVELGSPKTASTAFLVWTDDTKAVSHGRVTLIGPDIPKETRDLVPFGKIVLVSVSGFDEANTYDRFREMEMAKYDIHPAGYMMRAVSQHQREWSRISKKAKTEGFCLSILGKALIEKLSALPYVHGVEVIFVTSSADDVTALKAVGESVGKITGAMNKMGEEMDLDCDACEYSPVCDSVSELKKMRNSMQKKKTENKP
jgi:CO dehydrogenase/acetyl-CoA synthase beta subunit